MWVVIIGRQIIEEGMTYVQRRPQTLLLLGSTCSLICYVDTPSYLCLFLKSFHN